MIRYVFEVYVAVVLHREYRELQATNEYMLE